jgi:hypothetical protein
MAKELVNSRRRLNKVTYTPVELPESSDGGGALEVASAVGALDLVPGEAPASAPQNADSQTRDALTRFDVLAAASDPQQRLKASGALSRLPNAVLGRAVDAIRSHREAVATGALNDLAALIREYRAAQARHADDQARRLREANQLALEREDGVAGEREGVGIRAAVPFNQDLVRLMVTSSALAAQAPAQLSPVVATRLGADLAKDALLATTWADTEQPERAKRFTDLVSTVLPHELRHTATVLLVQGLPNLFGKTQITTTVKNALTRRRLQPIGLLHLEELVITPLQVERGELIYSLPLAPKEKVTVSHKEWSLKKEEYSRFVQDYFENYSERGVAEKSDIAVSSKSETEHSNTLSMNQSTAPGGTTLADPVKMQTNVTTEKQSEEKSRRDTREITERASALAIRDQKVSFTVTTVSGREDFTARLYENTHDNKMMMIDYFRRMRKWRNQLFRTGIRLTYDVVLPDPGRRLRERWLAIQQLDAAIAAPFEYTYGVKNPYAASGLLDLVVGDGGVFGSGVLSTINVDFDSASVDQLINIGRAEGITLPPAPSTLTASEEVRAITEAPPAGGNAVSLSLNVSIPSTHRPLRIRIGGRAAAGTPAGSIIASYGAGRRTVIPAVDGSDAFTTNTFALNIGEHATTDKVPIAIMAYGGAVGEVRVKVDLEPAAESWRQWRSQVWGMLRQAALAKYNDKREALRVQRAALLKELAAPDALTLRRMEREQIMHLVLEWLFPEFAKNASVHQALASGAAGAAQVVLEYGEYIKFVQEAIDWDSILVVLYPYFWDRPDNQAIKLYLNHDDAAHREFLRAGAARVVLAIRPGREREVVALLDQGELGTLAPASRFSPLITAVEEREKAFRARAEQATQPPEDSEDEPPDIVSVGVQIGAWAEWTPTSALDMDVELRPLS